VDVTSGPGFPAGVPKRLFVTRMKVFDANHQYDVSADGRRFLVNTLAEDDKADAITVVQNWRDAATK
jgi:hypothetical protein